MSDSNFILDFWNSQADKFQTKPDASWSDNYAIDLEIENIGKYIKKGDTVLDVGCANGFAAVRQLEKNNPAKVIGIDFAQSMIDQANVMLNNHPKKNRMGFSVGDITNIEFPDNSFDVVYTTRVLINIPNWESQLKGIEECLRVVKNDGVVILSEAFWEPLVKLNSLRSLTGLKSLVEHDFNRYLKKEKLEVYLKSRSIKFENIDFSSVYYLGSRFLRELVTNPNDYPGYSNPINEIFYNIEKDYSGGGFGIQQAYILRK